ncbi:hypothetical protein WA1_35860 [Scytonema hofmannii PCC 7110]|uniref:Uncharacterized protein n=1 Tax=Scytonema hofmannii PCC 7110 TaxID=128403 RepID=A0A139X1L4_9CYAN|nr:hypothetical protein [Scytonema hofmannii]KYC38564.1 hypothetical protein WA1_35860 [Scytonema hofmannii PCC 7110]
MPVTVDTQRTGRFIHWWSYVALGASALVFLSLMTAPFFKQTLIHKDVQVKEEEPFKIKSLQLAPQLIGALRVDVNAIIPDNRWVTYEIQLLDKQGKVLASGIKEAWKESGYWSEEGETGTWSEEDLTAGLDVRAKKNEEVTLALAVLGYGETSGKELAEAVPFIMTVENGVIDTRPLWGGVFWSTFFSVMALFATRRIGKKAISAKINDSDPNGRETVGGANRLVRVNVNIQSDETSPPELEVYLSINDSYGEQVYAGSFPVKLSFTKEKGKITKVTGKLEKFFILEQRASYGFHVEVLPDEPIYRTSLFVRDSVRTLQPVEVIRINANTVTSDQ